MAFIANCSLYGTEETGSLISLDIFFFSRLSNCTKYSVCFSYALWRWLWTSEVWWGRSSRTMLLLPRRSQVEKLLWESTPGNVPAEPSQDPRISLQHQGCNLSSNSQWASYLQWLGRKDFEACWVFKSHRKEFEGKSCGSWAQVWALMLFNSMGLG